jgi:hypothetical protein
MSGFLRTVCLAVDQMAPRITARLRSRGGAKPQSYLRYLALAAILAGFSVGTRAQDVASITGTVTDKTGAAISDADVKLMDTRTGAVYGSKTGVYGAYLFARVAPGPAYTLTVSKDSFKSVTVSNLYLAVATTRTQDITLEVGAVTQKVEVTSEGSVSLNTTDTTIGNNFDMHAVASLPNQFRDDPAGLLRLQPGVVSAPSSNDDNPQSASRDGSVAGARADQDNITVDGIDASDFSNGQAFATVSPIPLDAIQEFRTEVANPLAESGRGSGAQTIITTKGGTNTWHGAAREYHRNTVTEANDFFNNKAGVARPKLIRNQFGGNVGGPIKKDKLFFFFDYDGRRDASDSSQIAQVPLDHVRNNGDLAYVNNNPGCQANSTIQSSPNCISFATSAQLAQLDPCSLAACPGVTPGFDPGLLALFNSRYPHANDIAAGDGLNSGGFRFNAPNPFKENTYTTRVDYVISAKQKLFVRFNFNNVDTITPGLPSIQYPGDPLTNPEVVRDRSWAIGHTWTINANAVNQFVYGESRANVTQETTFEPAGPVFQLNWLLGTPWSAPFARPGGAASINPVPTFRDDLSLIRGKHDFQFGGLWKPIRTRSELINDLIFVNTGLGFTNTQLDPTLRPANILNDPTAASTWDFYYTSVLGIAPQQVNLTNFIKNGNAVPHLGGSRRDYRYYEDEAYVQDTWKIRSDFTLTYGLRYQYDSVPYETNGLEALPAGVSLNSILATRVQNGLNGVSGPTSTPLLTYVLGGKANPHAPSLYDGNKLNFSPRLGFAWNPGFRNGLLGSVLGEKKTVLRGGFGIIYDHNALSAVNFNQDQSGFLFQSVQTASVSGQTAELYLQNAPRIVDANTAPFSFPAPTFNAPPFTPFTTGSGSNLVVNGAASGQFGNYSIDPNFKTPYSLTYSAGLQRELPGAFQLEVDYYGRFGRRLITLGDAGQFTDFIDPASKQGEIAAITNLELAARAGAPTAPTQQFFENQINQALGAGNSCMSVFGTNCTQLVYSNFGTNLTQGNLVGIASSLTQAGLLSPGVGLSPQFLSNYYLSNRAWSSYNAMIATLRKRLSHDLQLDFNYTFSHSIDNSSQTAHNNSNPSVNAISALCDARNLNNCRGNSEFDVTHQISSTVIYDLPFGRGKWIGRNSARWLNEAIGGWEVAGIVTWHTGFAFPITSNAETTGFNTSAFALFNGNRSALDVNVHTDPNNNNIIQLFANPAAARAAFSPVTGQEIGSRDILRGPRFANTDLSVAKYFPLWSEKYKLQFRAEAYNAFNNVDFSLPISGGANIDLNPAQFGQITTTSNSARVLQFALRLDF